MLVDLIPRLAAADAFPLLTMAAKAQPVAGLNLAAHAAALARIQARAPAFTAPPSDCLRRRRADLHQVLAQPDTDPESPTFGDTRPPCNP